MVQEIAWSDVQKCYAAYWLQQNDTAVYDDDDDGDDDDDDDDLGFRA